MSGTETRSTRDHAAHAEEQLLETGWGSPDEMNLPRQIKSGSSRRNKRKQREPKRINTSDSNKPVTVDIDHTESQGRSCSEQDDSDNELSYSMASSMKTHTPIQGNPFPSPSPSPSPTELQQDSPIDYSFSGDGTPVKAGRKKHTRSYKNLSRSRRIVANARERNRVHTISAAFEGLRRAVPSYSHNQKLSKLAILKIACCYILALSRLADLNYTTESGDDISFAECVELCTKTLQAEGRSKRRKTDLC
ncbi:protein atonal homolog 8-like [Anneissia japonica]|uniref:protein atonal homolog 8-like n=1 Tax=Anneissia japonica TaxID=1529436 RepID=UPI00142553D3|nr:protein atonal homolog 8-like [Anneissia japonica]